MNEHPSCRDCLYGGICQVSKGKACGFFYSYETGGDDIAEKEYIDSVAEFFTDWELYETLMSGDARDDDQF